MNNLLFVGVLAFFLILLYRWSFSALGRERWQVLGTIPVRKQADGTWQGLNLTYYGLINACSITAAAALVLVLLTAVRLPLSVVLGVEASLLLLLTPLAKLIARWVEKKKHTFSIGGTACTGLIITPPLLWLLRDVQLIPGYGQLPVLEIMAALTIGYALGEGSGRLACISFGCCYGKPLSRLPQRLQRLLTRFYLIYEGETKKAVYAEGLGGCKTLAVPAFTAVGYSAAALIGALLFLEGHAPAAYLLCAVTTQSWRFISEFLRADYRGAGRISVYQYLALAALFASVIYYFVLPSGHLPADIAAGLKIIRNPSIILAGQAVWMVIFIYMGRSRVTAADIRLYVRTDRI